MKKSSMTQIDRNTQILSHIYNYCEKITKTIKRFSSSFDVFLNDSDYQDSVSMNLLQIGELVPKLSDDFIQCTSKSIPWRNIKGMRNLLAHDYGSMNIEIVWETAVGDIPALQDFCKPYAEQYQHACEEIDEEKQSFIQRI